MFRAISVVFCLLFAISAFAAEVGSIVVFTPENRLLSKQEITKIYQAAKKCDDKTAAAAPELVRAANKGDEVAKAALTAVHALCLRGAIDEILDPPPPEK